MLCKPFDKYIAECAVQIRRRRAIQQQPSDLDHIVLANSPFELRPAPSSTGNIPRRGALLIHGLLDSPFSLRDIAEQLKEAGVFSRAILLPGHGTSPNDLVKVTHQDWINVVRYGVDSLRTEVDEIYLIGYSTGATLSIHHALNDPSIKGIVLLAPALNILPPTSTLIKWPILANLFASESAWLLQEQEIDYVKYQSVPFNPVLELAKLINLIKETNESLSCRTLMTMSLDDETVSASAALAFFKAKANKESRSILYANNRPTEEDTRIEIRNASYPELNIEKMSHIAIPFSPHNPHYGQQGDYPYHSNPSAPNTVYGAYNRLQTKLYNGLYQAKLLRTQRCPLTYNPDFNYMIQSIIDFVTG